MAHEHTGLILCLAAALRSYKGRNLLLNGCKEEKKKRRFFPGLPWVYDWSLLLETQLQAEQWLGQDCIPKKEAENFGEKSKEYMGIVKRVGKRHMKPKSMGDCTMNFHGPQHMDQDIVNFGPPEGMNTKAEESLHRDDKKASDNTQKRPKTFEFQSLDRIEDRRLVALGVAELEGKRRWDYFHRPKNQADSSAPKGIQLGGARAVFVWDDENNDGIAYKVHTKMANKRRYKYSKAFRVFMNKEVAWQTC